MTTSRTRVLPRALAALTLGLGLTVAAQATPATAQTDTRPTARAISLAGFPNAARTGAHGKLRVVHGDRTIRRAGTVLENVEIHGSVIIDADRVTLRNVKVVSDGYWPLRVVSGSGVRLLRSTIVGTRDSQASVAGHFIGRRLDLHGAGDGARMQGGRLVNSYIHDLANFDGAHNDGIDAYGPVKIIHNTVLLKMGQTSAIMLSEYGSNPDTHVLVRNNLIGGGGYSFYGGAPDTARGHVVIDNLFTTRYFPRAGYWGPVAHWRSQGNTWSDNRWADGPRAGRLVRP